MPVESLITFLGDLVDIFSEVLIDFLEILEKFPFGDFLAIGIFFGPDVLACATRGGGRSEAGHCFHLLKPFFFFLSFYTFCFSPTSGILRKIIFFLAFIFWHN